MAAERVGLRTPRALLAGVATLLVAGSASAFCRTTTCDPKHEHCASADSCITDGHPLYWKEKCLSFATQEDGSPLRHIPYADVVTPAGVQLGADHIFRLAFLQWQTADCGGQPPSFKMWDVGPVVCDEPEFNDLLPNANIWMFRDKSWPYENESETLALTTVLFEKSTGVILDADVEVNSFATDLSTSDTHVTKDLQAIATHEAGHFLGLSHTLVPGATMGADYKRGSLDYRSLHPDDVAGICAAYPPDRDALECASPHPAHGFSRYCGGGQTAPQVTCQIGRLAGAPLSLASRWGLMALFAGVYMGLARRRRRSRHPRA